MKIVVASFTAAAALTAVAQTTAAPSQIHLAAGQYVQEDTACAGAPLAAMRMWDGSSFSDPHTSHCKTRVTKRIGQTFTLENVCTANGDGSPAQESKERITIRLLNDNSFRLVMPGVSANDKSALYRLCPSAQQ